MGVGTDGGAQPTSITCKHSHNVCTEKGAAVLAPSTPFNLLSRIWGMFFKQI